MTARRERPALIVAGMHRSGTSIVALAVEQLGIALGASPARSEHNPAGYGEDDEFVAVHRQLFTGAFDAPDDPASGHHHDWGYDPDETFDPARFAAVAAAAEALLDRDDGTGPWGWKDPRTTLVLDEWVGLLADPRVLLVVRHPDAVAASMAALGEGPWQDPALAHRIWRFYNRRVLDFARRSPVPTALVDGAIATRPPEVLTSVLADRLGLGVAAVPARFDHLRPDRFEQDPQRLPIPRRDRLASMRLWRRLRRLCVT